MKILILNLFYYPVMFGGTEHSTKLLAEKLAMRGHGVAVVTYDGEGEDLNTELINGVCVYRMHAPFFMRKVFHKGIKPLERIKYYINKYYYPEIKKQFGCILRDFQPDVVHTNNFFPSSIWKTVKRHNIKVIHTLRDYFLLDPQSRLDSSPKWIVRLHRSYEKWYSNRYIDIVTGPSEFILREHVLRGYFANSRKEVVVNAVDLNMDETKWLMEIKERRAEEKVRFCFAGALNKAKGFDTLLDAFAKVENESIILEICGNGDLLECLREHMEQDKRIVYHGKISAEGMKKVYADCDVMIVPSVWEEPFGRVVIEGMQHGMPVIGADRGGIKEILESTGAGAVYDCGSAEALKRQIENFSDRKYIQSFFKNIECGIMKYHVDRQIDRFEELYKGSR